MPTPSLTTEYVLAAIATVVGLFLTQGVIDNKTGQLVTGLASVFVPLGIVLARSIFKGHQAQASSRLEAAQINAAATREAHAPRSHAAPRAAK